MNQARRANLNKAFEATDYLVHTGDDWRRINIGRPAGDTLSVWLKKNCDASCAWIVTAYNPRAAPNDEAANRQRDAALKACLDAAGHRYVAANSRARDSTWPDEPGVCILDMDEGLARALALRFAQAAMVAVPVAGLPQLVWVAK